MTFTVDFQYDEELETVTGGATVEDCDANIKVDASFSVEDIEACIDAINDGPINEAFLNDELEVCLGLDVTDADIEEGDVAVVFGRYTATECPQKKCKRNFWGKRKGKKKRRGFCWGWGGWSWGGWGWGGWSWGGWGRKCQPVEEELEVISEGCALAIYVDCDEAGCVGDALAVVLVDDADPENVYYKNCGILTSGDIQIDLIEDDASTGSGGTTIVFDPVGP